MEPITKWSARVLDPKRIPELVDTAMRQALGGKPGPGLPRPARRHPVPRGGRERGRLARPGPRLAAAARRRGADRRCDHLLRRPSGRSSSPAAACCGRTPKPSCSSSSSDRHPLLHHAAGPRRRSPRITRCPILTARSTAFREADLVLVVGTRINYIIGKSRRRASTRRQGSSRSTSSRRRSATTTRPTSGSSATRRPCCAQLLDAADGRVDPDRFSAWREHLARGRARKRAEAEAAMAPTRRRSIRCGCAGRCATFWRATRSWCVDGQEILNYGRQSIPTFVPRHRLNSGAFGTMGVGCRSASAPRSPSPTRRCSCCTATARSG